MTQESLFDRIEKEATEEKKPQFPKTLLKTFHSQGNLKVGGQTLQIEFLHATDEYTPKIGIKIMAPGKDNSPAYLSYRTERIGDVVALCKTLIQGLKFMMDAKFDDDPLWGEAFAYAIRSELEKELK